MNNKKTCIELLNITLLTVLFLVVLGGGLILGELVIVGDNLLIWLLRRGPGRHSWDNSSMKRSLLYYSQLKLGESKVTEMTWVTKIVPSLQCRYILYCYMDVVHNR